MNAPGWDALAVIDPSRHILRACETTAAGAELTRPGTAAHNPESTIASTIAIPNRVAIAVLSWFLSSLCRLPVRLRYRYLGETRGGWYPQDYLFPLGSFLDIDASHSTILPRAHLLRDRKVVLDRRSSEHGCTASSHGSGRPARLRVLQERHRRLQERAPRVPVNVVPGAGNARQP